MMPDIDAVRAQLEREVALAYTSAGVHEARALELLERVKALQRVRSVLDEGAVEEAAADAGPTHDKRWQLLRARIAANAPDRGRFVLEWMDELEATDASRRSAEE